MLIHVKRSHQNNSNVIKYANKTLKMLKICLIMVMTHQNNSNVIKYPNKTQKKNTCLIMVRSHQNNSNVIKYANKMLKMLKNMLNHGKVTPKQ